MAHGIFTRLTKKVGVEFERSSRVYSFIEHIDNLYSHPPKKLKIYNLKVFSCTLKRTKQNKIAYFTAR